MAEKFTLHKIAVAGISGDKDWRGLARIVKFSYRLFGIKAKSIESELRAGGAVGRAVGGATQIYAPTPEISFPEQGLHSEPPSAYFPVVQLVHDIAAATELFPLGQ